MCNSKQKGGVWNKRDMWFIFYSRGEVWHILGDVWILGQARTREGVKPWGCDVEHSGMWNMENKYMS